MKRRLSFPGCSRERNWEEDFDKENGQYLNNCITCKQLFIGYKRRIVCKACFTATPVATK